MAKEYVYYTMTYISEMYKLSMAEVKSILIGHKLAVLEDKKTVASDEALEAGSAVEKTSESNGEEYKYYKYKKELILSIFNKVEPIDEFLYVRDWRHAVAKLKEYSKHIEKDRYFHTFKHEIDTLIKELIASEKRTPKKDQQEIFFCIGYLKASREYVHFSDNALL